jgi:hypothetical protein
LYTLAYTKQRINEEIHRNLALIHRKEDFSTALSTVYTIVYTNSILFSDFGGIKWGIWCGNAIEQEMYTDFWYIFEVFLEEMEF